MLRAGTVCATHERAGGCARSPVGTHNVAPTPPPTVLHSGPRPTRSVIFCCNMQGVTPAHLHICEYRRYPLHTATGGARRTHGGTRSRTCRPRGHPARVWGHRHGLNGAFRITGERLNGTGRYMYSPGKRERLLDTPESVTAVVVSALAVGGVGATQRSVSDQSAPPN